MISRAALNPKFASVRSAVCANSGFGALAGKKQIFSSGRGTKPETARSYRCERDGRIPPYPPSSFRSSSFSPASAGLFFALAEGWQPPLGTLARSQH